MEMADRMRDSSGQRGTAVRVGSVVRILIAVALVSGCSGGRLNIKPIPLSSNPTEQVEALTVRIDQATQAQTNVLAPDSFDAAARSLEQARTELEDGGSMQKILGFIAEGQAHLDNAEKFAAVSQTLFPTVIEARSAARRAGAMSLGTSYNEAEERFVALMAAVENDDIAWAKKRAPKVERAFRSVELQAIKSSTADEIRSLIAQARENGAEDLVPDTLAEAEKMNAALDEFITEHRYAGSEIGVQADEALFQANRLVALTALAASYSDRRPEEIALRQEAFVSAVANELVLPSLADRSFQDQRTMIIDATRELRRDRDFVVSQAEQLRKQTAHLNATIADLEGQSSEERSKLARLEAEKRLQDLYDELSDDFDQTEAEVYLQGQQLIIRLKGVQFPIGGHVLAPPSYPLLAKVQKAIREFGEATVVVEGHTDSSGTTEVNQHLSQERAEAVVAYLLSNNTLPAGRVTAVGKGFDEPIASNKTNAGRALNRRIDVVIDAGPVSSPTAAVSAGPTAGN